MTDRDAVATMAPRQATGGDEILAVEGVSVRLAGREVLHDVRFAIQAGEFEVRGWIGVAHKADGGLLVLLSSGKDRKKAKQ